QRQHARPGRAAPLPRLPPGLRPHVLARPPLALEIVPSSRDGVPESVGHFTNQLVGLLNRLPRLVDESRLDVQPSGPEPIRLFPHEQGSRGSIHRYSLAGPFSIVLRVAGERYVTVVIAGCGVTPVVIAAHALLAVGSIFWVHSL